MIWVPMAGSDGFRYRDALRPLAAQELTDTHYDAMDRVITYIDDPSADLAEWQGHAPALTVLVQWTVYALMAHGLITDEDAQLQFTQLADIQRVIHHGRPNGWSPPPWWGSDVHREHQTALIATYPQRYSEATFGHG
ncbi:hypothetical protein [Mycolicibacterium fortuitum]|uniref:hypothetical protein n=1 Tax=Mycolicibacterium fortuitum TaxID=1766 RepID=UPI003AB04764